MSYEVNNFLEELLIEKKKIQKMNPCLLKTYALWDIKREIKNEISKRRLELPT